MGATPALLESLTGAVVRDASYVNATVWVSTHSANPGTTGAFELTSGTGAAGRQQATFNSGGSGSDPTNATVTVAVPGAQTIPWVGLWSAQTGGTFLGGYPLVVYPFLVAVGISGVTDIDCPANGLSDSVPVRLFTIPNAPSAVPAGLSGDPTVYWTRGTTVDTIELSATDEGDAITPSGSGAFFVAPDATATFGGVGGNFILNVGNLTYATVS